MEKANTNQTIFSSKPLGVTAGIFPENIALSLLKIVSMYWRIGLPKNSSHAGISRLEFFLRWAFRCRLTSWQEVFVVVVGVAFVGTNDRAFGQSEAHLLEDRDVRLGSRR